MMRSLKKRLEKLEASSRVKGSTCYIPSPQFLFVAALRKGYNHKASLKNNYAAALKYSSYAELRQSLEKGDRSSIDQSDEIFCDMLRARGVGNPSLEKLQDYLDALNGMLKEVPEAVRDECPILNGLYAADWFV